MVRRLSSGRPGTAPSSTRDCTYAHIPGGEPGATAEYIADMSGSLARMAADARLYSLTHLLNLVRLEAAELCRKPPPTGQGSDTRLPP